MTAPTVFSGVRVTASLSHRPPSSFKFRHWQVEPSVMIGSGIGLGRNGPMILPLQSCRGGCGRRARARRPAVYRSTVVQQGTVLHSESAAGGSGKPPPLRI